MNKTLKDQSRPAQGVTAALRGIAFAVGASILSASTWAVIDVGQLAGSHAALACALSAGLACGSAIIPRLTSRALVVGLCAVLAVAELSNMLAVIERVVVTRDATASSVKGAVHSKGQLEQRLLKAETALAEHRTAAVSTVSQRGCGPECRTLLEGTDAKLSADAIETRKAAQNAPGNRSASPLADHLGVAPWLLDVIAALLLSVGANGLAAVLIGWSAHAGRRDPQVNQREPITVASAAIELLVERPQMPNGSADVRDPVTPILPSGTDPISARTRGVLKLIQASGGTLSGSQRKLADQLGISQPVLSRCLTEARNAGLVAMTADKVHGTRLDLVTA